MIERVEAAFINLELRERTVGNLGVYSAGAFHGREVAHAAKQATRYPRRAPRAASDFMSALCREPKGKKPRAAPHDLLELRHAIEVEPDGNAEALPERRGEEPGARGGADEREA